MNHTLTYRSKSPGTNIGGYRYFFNGQEGDNEVFGEVANFGYEFRQYDSRLARWWSVDPKWNEYPSVSPYVFCMDNPIMLVDPDGEKVVPFGLLEYYGKAKYGNSHLGEVQKIGIYNVIPIYDNNNKIISYNAVREYTIRGETYWRTEYQMDPSDLGDFKDNIRYYESCANMIYAFGEPDWRYVALGDKLTNGKFGTALNIFGSVWQDAITKPDFWLSIALSTGYTALNIKSNSILTNARNGKGNFGLGSATVSEANLAGAKWVGEGARLSSSGKAWISADGTRQYRMPAHKKKSGKYQANFESRSSADGKWTNDGHLDIITE